MEFDLEDFTKFHRDFRFYYWGGNSRGHFTGEHYYGVAAWVGNTSAAASFEQHVKRKPFFLPGQKRAAIGTQVIYDGTLAMTVTSFSKDNTLINLTAYGKDSVGAYYVSKKIGLTHREFKASTRSGPEVRYMPDPPEEAVDAG